jgi:hypothetical protein
MAPVLAPPASHIEWRRVQPDLSTWHRIQRPLCRYAWFGYSTRVVFAES